MIFSILVHMFSVYFMKAYRKPREFGWLSGMACSESLSLRLFRLSSADGRAELLRYQGRPADPAAIPLLARPSPICCAAARMSASSPCSGFSHYTWLFCPQSFCPCLASICGLCSATATPYRRARKPNRPCERNSIPFMPNFLVKDLAMWLISLNILALLASVFPWTLGKQADPLVPAPSGIHPEWYFMSPFEMLKLLGNVLPGRGGRIAGILIFTLGIALWVLIPFYDINKESGQRARNRPLLWTSGGLVC